MNKSVSNSVVSYDTDLFYFEISELLVNRRLNTIRFLHTL